MYSELRETRKLAWGYKTFFMLNSTEHEISTADELIKTKMLKK